MSTASAVNEEVRQAQHGQGRNRLVGFCRNSQEVMTLVSSEGMTSLLRVACMEETLHIELEDAAELTFTSRAGTGTGPVT